MSANPLINESTDERKPMPNGGYPMHLLTPLGDCGVEILTSGRVRI
jgi:hypothetical protein